MKKGFFITFEGLDGSGKTTQIKLLEEYIKSKGYEVVLTREPGGTDISEQIRTLILDTANTRMAPITEMMLYSAARAQLVAEVIKPAISNGKVVLCDRFVDSSYVYQGFGRGIDLKIVHDVNKIALNGIEPDITFFFDIDPQNSLKRRFNATAGDRIESESIEFHTKVYNGYKKLSELYPERIKVIDCMRSIDEIFADLKKWIDIMEINKRG